MQTEQNAPMPKPQVEKFKSYNEFLRRFYPEPEKVQEQQKGDADSKGVTVASYRVR